MYDALLSLGAHSWCIFALMSLYPPGPHLARGHDPLASLADEVRRLRLALAVERADHARLLADALVAGWWLGSVTRRGDDPVKAGTGTGAGRAAVEVMPAVGHRREPARLGASPGIRRDGAAIRMREMRENETTDTRLSEGEH